MAPDLPPDVELLALHARPRALEDLLPDGVRDRIGVVEAGAVDVAVSGSADLRGRVVTFPVDGPPSAVGLAITSLFRDADAFIAVACTPGRAPTAWWVLDLMSHHAAPGVDVRQVEWFDATGLWWTHPTGPVRLPLVVADRESSSKAASVLQIADAVGADDPVARWLGAAADGAHDLSRWDDVLCARYLTMACARVASTSRTGTV